MKRAKEWTESYPYLFPQLSREAHIERVRKILQEWRNTTDRKLN